MCSHDVAPTGLLWSSRNLNDLGLTVLCCHDHLHHLLHLSLVVASRLSLFHGCRLVFNHLSEHGELFAQEGDDTCISAIVGVFDVIGVVERFTDLSLLCYGRDSRFHPACDFLGSGCGDTVLVLSFEKEDVSLRWAGHLDVLEHFREPLHSKFIIPIFGIVLNECENDANVLRLEA